MHVCMCTCMHMYVYFPQLHCKPEVLTLGAHKHPLGSSCRILRPHHQKFCLSWSGLGPGECMYLTFSLGDSNVQPWFRAIAVSFLINRKMVHESAQERAGLW